MTIITQEYINQMLIKFGPTLLKTKYQKIWTKEKPTTGYCYLLSEMLYHYIILEKCTPCCMNFGEDIGTHWFIKKDHSIIDFSANQFDFRIDYSSAKGKGFFKGSIPTHKGFISKNGYLLAQYLKVI